MITVISNTIFKAILTFAIAVICYHTFPSINAIIVHRNVSFTTSIVCPADSVFIHRYNTPRISKHIHTK